MNDFWIVYGVTRGGSFADAACDAYAARRYPSKEAAHQAIREGKHGDCDEYVILKLDEVVTRQVEFSVA